MNKSDIVSLSNKSDKGYWLRVEQPDADEPATQEEAASIIDAAFSIEPCIEIDTVVDGPVSQDEFKRRVSDRTNLNVCNLTYDRDYTCTVNVVLSDPDLPYKLVLTNGKTLETSLVQENREDRLIINMEGRVEIPYPVIGGASFKWVSGSNNPIIRVNDRYLEWDGEATGVILLSYYTEYYQHKVIVYHDGDQVGECMAIGFYQRETDSIDLEIPFFQEEDDRFKSGYCKSNTNISDEEDKPRWVQTEIKYYCECSGEYHHSIYSEEPQGEDRNNYKWPKAVNTQEVNGGYINCGEVTQDINDPEFYKEICCQYPEVVLPRCYEYYRKKSVGKTISEADKLSYILQYGADKVKFTPVSPADGDCGTLTVRQKKTPRNCCEGVPPIYFDEDSTPDVLPAGGAIIVYAEGGILPFTFTVANDSLSFGGSKSITVNSKHAILHADNAFCGFAVIKVTDGCSSDVMEVRSTQGEWVQLPELDRQCVAPGIDAIYTTISGVGYWDAEGYAGRYKIRENQAWCGYGINNQDSYRTINNTIANPGGVVGCGVVEGDCDAYYWCTYTTCSLTEAIINAYNSCNPGTQYYPEDGDGAYCARTCLNAGTPGGMVPGNYILTINKSGRVFEVALDAGVNSGYVCNLSNIGQFYRKLYVGIGPVGTRTWEWVC